MSDLNAIFYLDGCTITVTPAYDENGIPIRYMGGVKVDKNRGVVTFDPPPMKSADGQPECQVVIMYETQF